MVNNHQIRLVLLGIVFLSFTCFSRSEAASFKGLGGGEAHAISADGSTVVGESGDDAWRWTQSGGRQNLGFLPGEDWSEAHDVSADGSVVVGSSDSTLGTQGEAFRWTESGGMVGLGDMPGGAFLSQGLGVSDDGSMVVGMGWSSSGYEAFCWNEAGGMVGLGDLSGGNFDTG